MVYGPNFLFNVHHPPGMGPSSSPRESIWGEAVAGAVELKDQIYHKIGGHAYTISHIVTSIWSMEHTPAEGSFSPLGTCRSLPEVAVARGCGWLGGKHILNRTK